MLSLTTYVEGVHPVARDDLRQLSLGELETLYERIRGLVQGALSTPRARAMQETAFRILEITQGFRPEHGEYLNYGSHNRDYFHEMSNATTRTLQGLSRGRSSARSPPPPYRSRDRQSPSPSRSDRAPFPRPPPRWALGPFDESGTQLPDTHRLTIHTRPHRWEHDFIRTWSSPELRRVVRQIFAEEDPDSRDPRGTQVSDTILHIKTELRKRDNNPEREERVVTERLQPAPTPPPQQQDVHLHGGRREIHVHAPPPEVVHVQAPAPPPRVIYHQDQATTRVVYHHTPLSQTAYTQRSRASQPYERPAPQADDVEFRPRGRIEGKKGKGKGKRVDSSDEND